MPRKLITDSYRGWYGREDHTSSIYRISNHTVWDCRHKMDLEKFRLQTTVQRLDDTMKFQQQVQTKEYKTVRDEYSRILAEQKVFQMHAFQHYDTALTKGSNPEPPNHSSKRLKRPKTEMSLVSKSAEDRTSSEGPFNRISFPSVNGRDNSKTTKKLPRVRSAEKINSDSSTDDLTSRKKKTKKNSSKGNLKILWDSETNKGDASQSDWPTKQTEVTKQTEAEEKLARAKLSRMSSKEKSFFLTQSDIMTSTTEEEENEEEEGVTTQTHRKDRTRTEHLQTDEEVDLLPSVREGHKPRSDSFQHIQYILDEKHSTIPVGVKSTVPTDVKCMGPTHIPKKTIPSTVTDQKQISQERYKVPPLQLDNSKNSSKTMTNSSPRQSPRTTVVVSGSESSKAEAVHSGALFFLGRHHGAQKNSTSKEDDKSKTVIREESEPLTAEKRSLITMDRIKSNTGVQENSGPNAEEECRVVPSSEVQPSLSVVKPEEASSKTEASSTKAVVILPSAKPSLLSGLLSARPQASGTDSSRVENATAVVESASAGAPRSGKPSLLSLSGKLSASPQPSGTDSSRVENTPPGNEATFHGAPRSGKPSLLSLSGKLSASPQASGTDSSRVENTPPGNEAIRFKVLRDPANRLCSRSRESCQRVIKRLVPIPAELKIPQL